jgi:hypothetical protein
MRLDLGPAENRRVRLGFSAATAGVAYVGPMLIGANPVGALFFLLLGSLPCLGYIGGIRSRVGSWIVGMALLGNALWTQLYVMERTEAGSSTAGVGYLYLLYWGLLIFLVGVGLDALIRLRTRGE